jgi:hypothetical protein
MLKALIVGGQLGDLDDDGVVLGLAAAFAAAAAGFLGSLSLMEIRRLSHGEQREVSIAELANHPGVALFRLRDGHVEAQAVHTKSHLHHGKKTSSSYEHAVAPVLPPGWRPGEPVRVWAVCHNFSEGYPEKDACLKAWRTPPGGAVVVDPELEPCYRRTVPAGDVPRDGRLVFVHWVESPEAYLKARWQEVLGFIRGTAMTWGVLAALWLLGSTCVCWRRSAAS